MSGNTLGEIFRVTTYGESHGHAIGGIIDGCPSGVPIDLDNIRYWLQRRRPGSEPFSTTRMEPDKFQILSGVVDQQSTGAPIAFIVPNVQQNPSEHKANIPLYRPGHGDYSWHKKYGHYDATGGGRYSARETVARVIAGAIASSFLKMNGIKTLSWVSGIGEVILKGYSNWSEKQIEDSPIRCPDPEKSSSMLNALDKALKDGDTLGGIISTKVSGLPPGLGEPVFDKAEALLARAILSIPSVKAFEIGEGFRAASMRGSEHNDPFVTEDGEHVTTLTNHAGGILGGITTGNDLLFRVGFKPVSSIRKLQQTITKSGQISSLDLSHGRNDVCVIPRAVPIVEAMTNIVLADLILRNRSARI